MTDRVIVVGDDGSKGATLAWQWITHQRWTGWNLDVVTAAETFHSGLLTTTDAPLAEWEPPTSRPIPSHTEIGRVRNLTKAGDPRAVLGDCHYADLLVVGATGMGSFKTMLVGSTADWLLHQPPAPLALVRNASPVESVLLCVDGSRDARHAVEVETTLPWAKEARTQVFSADDGRVDADASLQEALVLLQASGVAATTRRATGRATHAILQTLDNWEGPLPLVVLGTRGLTNLHRLWLGSTAAAVTRHSSANVIVVSAGALAATE